MLTCRDGKKKKCLTLPQLKAVRKIYSTHYDKDEELYALFFSIREEL